MADVTLGIGSGSASKRFRDMGDGTFAEVVYTSGSVSNSLAQPLVARQLAAGAASANTVLTATARRVSLYARTADIRYEVTTSGTATASATSHFIAAGERLDIAVPPNGRLAVIRAGSTDGVLEVSELS